MMGTHYIGSRVKRTEDPRLIQGIGHYVDDIKLADTLEAVFVRSIYSHARIKSIDTAAAKAFPGVVAVYTGADMQARIGSVPCASSIEGLKVPFHPPLAIGMVRYVGEPVAVVVARDKYIAADAAALVNIDCDPLDAVVDPEKAAEPGAPLVHEEFGDNIAYRWKLAGGDMDKAFKDADRIIKTRIVHQRLIPAAMEPRGVQARWLPGEKELTLWSSTQIPHLLRTQLAIMLGLSENRLRIITPEVGGGFGSKLNVYGEEAVIGWISMQLGRPVKWMESRRENFQATIQGRAQTGEIEAAVKSDGTILGLHYRIVADLGAYHQLLTPAIPTLTGLMLGGAYRFKNCLMDVTAVFTNKVATDAYRGAGRPEATFTVERIVDIVAHELKMDPVELRRKNFPKPSEFPFVSATGLTYDSGNYEPALDRALEMVNYAGLREEQARRRKDPSAKLLGIGLSSYVEICAMGPSPAMPAGGWESATVRVEPTGKVTVLSGASPHGQGQETSFAQIAADELGVDLNDVLVVHGDTAIVQYGIGTFGSRATAVGGSAVYYAIQNLKAKAGKIAAHMMGIDPAQVKFERGTFANAGDSQKTLTIQQVAAESYNAKNIPADSEPGLAATYFFEPKNFTFPFGTHVCVVEIDRETGEYDVTKYVAVDDCGRVINPLLVDGQIHGGIVQGLGQAMLEEAIYDENGQLITGEFMDYAMPRAHNFPRFELDRTETPTDVNPLGVKGVGEAGTIGSTPALVNAVVDALAHFGVRHVDMPLRPEKIWKLIPRDQ